MAPSLARAALAGFSRERQVGARHEHTLALLVSELVTNAVLHSDAPSASTIELRARLVGFRRRATRLPAAGHAASS